MNKTIKEDDDDAVSSSDEEGDENADIYVPGDQLESGQTLEVPAFNSSVMKPERKQFFLSATFPESITTTFYVLHKTVPFLQKKCG